MITDELPKLTQRLGVLAKVLKRPEAGVKAAGRAVQNVLTKHFREKNQVLNKRGWKKSGFWAQIRQSVQLDAQGMKCSVVINDPRFNQRLYGGVITPKTGKALAIPLKEEFKGVNPSTFGKDRFFLIKSKKGKNLGILAEKNSDGSLKLCYVLRRSVKQDADATALPKLEVIEATARKALEDAIMRELGLR